MKFIVTAFISVILFGCAVKSTTPSVQEQLDTYKSDVEEDHTVMIQKNTEQDVRLSEIESKIDRWFRKGN